MAQGVFKELTTLWGFDIDMGPLEKMEKGVVTLKSALGHTAEFATGLVAGLFGISDFTSNTGHDILMTAERLDISTDAFQRWSRAARMSGVDTESFKSSLTYLNNQMQELSIGGGKEFLTMLGQFSNVSPMADGHVKDVITFLKEVAPDLAKMENPGLFNKLLFGRGDPAMANLLRDFVRNPNLLNEVMAGGTYSTRDLAQGERFLKLKEKLKLEAEGVGRNIGVSVMPQLDSMMEKFSAWVESGSGQKFLLHDLPDALKVILALVTKIAQIGAPIAGWTAKTIANGGKPNNLDEMLGFGDVSALTGKDKKNFSSWDKAHADQMSRAGDNYYIYGATDPSAVAREIVKIKRQNNQNTQPGLKH